MKRILVAVDRFEERHISKIESAVSGWAQVISIPEQTPPAEYAKHLATADIAVGWPAPELLLKHPIEFLQIGSAGPDKYLHKGLDRLPMRACSARGNYATGIAEHGVAMLLYFVRKLGIHISDMEERRFQRHEPYGEISGMTICVVGLGASGCALAKRLKAFGTTVIGVDREKPAPVDRRYERNEFATAVAESDAVYFIIPGGPDTRHIVNADLLSCFKPTAYLFNISRGSILDENALHAALSTGRLAGAGLDVAAEEPMPADNPLWQLDNVLITGHSAGLSYRVYDRLCDLTVDNLIRYHTGKPLLNELNLDAG